MTGSADFAAAFTTPNAFDREREPGGLLDYDGFVVKLAPVQAQVVDEAGHVTGVVDDPEMGRIIEQSIPDSFYEQIGETKFVYVPEDGVFTATFRATDAGHLSMVVRDLTPAGPRRTLAFPRVPLTESTFGQLVVDTRSADIPTLLLDRDGDGAFDESVQPTAVVEGEAAEDDRQPDITIGSPVDGGAVEGKVTVVWSAVDDGAGVLTEVAELDADTPQAQMVANVSTLCLPPGEHTLAVVAEDRLGNVQVEVSRFEVRGPYELGALISFLEEVWQDGLIAVPGT